MSDILYLRKDFSVDRNQHLLNAEAVETWGRKWTEASVTYNPANLAAGATANTTVTVQGAKAGDFVQATHDQIGANDVILHSWVSADDTVRVVFQNISAGAIDVASGTLRVLVRKRGT